ncbi:hypothetical protein F959_00126 [Acinetobacter venetianus RAG-1 = CIP 110063]|uniref:Lipoprotein n=1 Tax=Acinetobacter venetianus (strain ATCC 31012 / DSM 23050 / BCRC 14357 / CCUG 45561 / CIP 110063 / KCTC 2702 / LMG 19082 / RAG-1) TaxID=1191460 RepID=N8YQI9_ACIVR|nr:hypothetical protein [Acinetobacter venetianus]ENV38991.1 hypothetical protein F959_00126 [Acinetobacter venetianus RAG-1 = CIP 110063]
MKKQLLISLSLLSLVACSDENDDIYGTVDPKNKAFYSYDIATANTSNKLTKKSYQVDKNNDLLISYTETPKLQTEALRNFITNNGISTIFPPQNTNAAYIVGRKAIFSDTVLEYEPSNLEQRTSFKLTYQLKKIDLSGLDVSNYVSYFLTQASASSLISDATLQIIQALLLSTQDKFPSGATCWQKQVQLSTQDYIESYPTQNLSHVSTNSNIQNQGIWQNAAWTAFQPNTEMNLADTRIRHQSREYWGFYHNTREVNAVSPANELACDFFNESAFKSVDRVLSKVL